MKSYDIKKVGFNKGAPRIWLEGSSPAKGGFLPGVKYRTTSKPEESLLILDVVEDGMRVVSSKKTKSDREIPVIDLNSKELLSMFDGVETVRVIVQDQRIFILPVASDLRAKERLARLESKLLANEALSTGSLSTGIGILDAAVHTGLAAEGIETNLVFANEIREDCMEHAVDRNPVFNKDTVTLTAPMQELAFDEWAMSRLPKCDILAIGMPCSGASIAGRTKGKLAHPEAHEHVGHLVVPFLAIVARTNPAIVVLECVVPYRSSASMDIIRNQLRDLGYNVHETELDAAEWNMLEHRKRLCMVAVTKGMAFSFDELVKPSPEVHCFGEIMDQVDPAHTTWGNIDYLWSKLSSDKAAGKGFAPTVVDASSIKLPVLNKTLHKRQSTGTFIQHPTNPNLYRIPTVAEHARAKGIKEALVAETTQTFGHETCGQAISVPPFVSVFSLVGRALKYLVSAGRQVEATLPCYALRVAA
jgi:DNA (cytosine-5)-methyltransferase 1